MKSTIAALLFGLIATASVPPPADACGVKLTIKGSAHKKGIARTSNPSDVLLLGNPPRRLSRDLSSAGHRVEIAPNTEAAKRKSYAVVIADNSQAGDARQKFPSAVVLVRSGDVTADMRTVENQVARKPVKADEGREVIDRRQERVPVAVGPIQPKREIVGAAKPSEEPPKPIESKPIETKPVSQPPPVEKVEKAKPEPAPQPEVASNPPENKPDVKPPDVKPDKPAKPSKSRSGSEIYFGLGVASADVNALKAVIKWLKDSPDVEVTVEGHADPTGNHDANMALSQKRAEWVRDALVAAGIDSSRVEVKAFGDTQLKYGAKDRRNRRIAVVAK